MTEDEHSSHMLREGARRSLQACSVPANDAWPVRVWRRHKWLIIGVGLFLLIDLLVLGGVGSTGSGGW